MARKMKTMHKFRRDVDHKLRVLRHASDLRCRKACRYFGVGRASFYRWRTAYRQRGVAGLENRKTAPKNPANRTAPEIVEKVLHLRKTYHLGPMRIVWYLSRYHAVTISHAGVYRILKRHGLSRLPSGTRVRKIHSQRYEKQVPGHQIQVDVKFLKFDRKDGKSIKRYQYTAIDDATRIRALKIYDRHNQANAIDFINTVIARFPFRIREVRPKSGMKLEQTVKVSLSASMRSLRDVGQVVETGGFHRQGKRSRP
ncbi:transposase [Mesorhizobium camelthorni]|uniref:Transposase n=1 Tax=Allomesorhizobium camelthorni TaxID=475069 RepID=A0A6G4WN66_9HYPH|nr:transposase [Mesorhizobium camelthorni]